MSGIKTDTSLKLIAILEREKVILKPLKHLQKTSYLTGASQLWQLKSGCLISMFPPRPSSVDLEMIKTSQFGVVVHTFNISTWEAD